MRYRLTIFVLALGTVIGYGSGIARLVHAHSMHCTAAHHSEEPSSK
jgi:hypothetical protein